MTKQWTIENHVAFQWSVVRALAAGTLLGLCHTAMAPGSATLSLFSTFSGHWAWLYGAASLALLGAATQPAKNRRQAWLLLLLCVVSGTLTFARMQFGDWAAIPAVLAWSLLLAIYFAQSAVGFVARGVTFALTLLAGVAAQLLPDTMEAQGLLLAQPLWVANGVAGGCVGLLLGAGSVGRFVVQKDVPASLGLAALVPPAESQDELSKLIRQALLVYRETEGNLTDHPNAKAAAEQLVVKIDRFGKRWQDILAQTQKTDRQALDERKQELKTRLENTTDDGTISEYRRALSAIEEQMRYLDDIDKGRQRAIARLHHQVATLERLRLAAIRHRSVGADKLNEELKPMIEELNQAGQDLDTAVEVLSEL